MDDTGSASAPRREKRRLGKWWRLGHRWGQEGRRDRHRQTDTQTDMQTLRQHPLGASRRPKNHAGFHCTHAPTSERQYFSPRCHPLGPENLRTDSGKLARPQRKLCQTTCEHTTNDSKQAHAVRCGKDVGGRNAGPRKLRQGGSGGEGHQCYHLEPPVVPCEQNSVPFDGECGGSTTQPRNQRTTRGSDKWPQMG